MPGVLLCSGSWRFGIMAFDLKSTYDILVITMNFAIEAQDDGIRGGIGPRTDAPLIGPPSKRELTECVCKAWQS